MANQKIQDIEGIGPATGDKLRAAGVTDTDTLLAKSGTPGTRKALADVSGLSEAQGAEVRQHCRPVPRGGHRVGILGIAGGRR